MRSAGDQAREFNGAVRPSANEYVRVQQFGNRPPQYSLKTEHEPPPRTQNLAQCGMV